METPDFMSTATTPSHDTGQRNTIRTTTSPSNTPTSQLERSVANRLRATMAAVRLAFTWRGFVRPSPRSCGVTTRRSADHTRDDTCQHCGPLLLWDRHAGYKDHRAGQQLDLISRNRVAFRVAANHAPRISHAKQGLFAPCPRHFTPAGPSMAPAGVFFPTSRRVHASPARGRCSPTGSRAAVPTAASKTSTARSPWPVARINRSRHSSPTTAGRISGLLAETSSRLAVLVPELFEFPPQGFPVNAVPGLL
jgi:hypothetical protein